MLEVYAYAKGVSVVVLHIIDVIQDVLFLPSRHDALHGAPVVGWLDMLFEQGLQRVGISAQDALRSLKLLPQDANASLVHHSAQVVARLERVLHADEMALRADARGPALAPLW